MEISTILELIFNALSAIGALMAGIVAIITIPKIANKLIYKTEKIYGMEATERANHIENKNQVYINEEYKGGDIKTPQLVLKKVDYNPQIMVPKWENVEQVAYYYYEDEQSKKKMVKYWLLKKTIKKGA